MVILIDILNAQIHLNRTNLVTVCACNPMQETFIYLNSKNIKKIHPATFTGLTSLERLNLDSNQISSIDPDTFKGLTSLQELNLFYNQISSIVPATFKGLTSLRYIHQYPKKVGYGYECRVVTDTHTRDFGWHPNLFFRFCSFYKLILLFDHLLLYFMLFFIYFRPFESKN